ncbi:hypothetical protein [Emticicia fontis]
MTKSKNSITINIGGADRKLTFGMLTQELYLEEIAKKRKDKNFNEANPVTLIVLLFYCGMVIGDGDNKSLPKDFSTKVVAGWIDDCEDEEGIENAKQLALTAMGFISLAENSQLSRQVEQAQAMGIDLKEKFKKQFETSIES